ncbi:unnamed protein product [Closterium sp. Yama58-4]|nr:unnamed protein product [Closterium sp. Yama58-4]
MHAYMSPRVLLDELRNALVELFVDADLPPSLVQMPWYKVGTMLCVFVCLYVHARPHQFRRFVNLLNPSAADMLGSCYRLARDMQAFSEVAREELRQEIIGNGLVGRVSLSLDIWTRENHTAFMCVTVHWITSDFKLRQGIQDFVLLEGSHTGSLIAQTLERTLTPQLGHLDQGEPYSFHGSHTGSLIAQTLECILTEAGLQDVVFAVTTDNAENNNRAMRLLSGATAEGPDAWTSNPLLDIARHVRYVLSCHAATHNCLAHVMNIAVQDALKLDDVREALKCLRNECSYIGWSVQRSESFASLQRRLAGRDNAKVQRLTAVDKLETTFPEPGVSPLTQALITKALGKLKKYSYGSKEELTIATFLDPRYKSIFFQLPEWEALNAAHVTEVGGCARSVQGVDEPTVIRLVRDQLVAYQ